MKEYVLDSSMTLSWQFEDEGGLLSNQLLEHLDDTTLHVPALWLFEVCNGLLVGMRKGRIAEGKLDVLIRDVLCLPVVISPPMTNTQVDQTLLLARKHNLTAYDAAYLELALRLGVPLATLDKDLARAAQSENTLLTIDG